MQLFAEFLREKGRIQSRYLPFYLRWAAMYEKHAAGSGTGDGCTQSHLESFLATLAHQYQDWQVRQARHAVRLYLYFSRSGEKLKGPALESPEEASTDSQESLELTLTRLMRLKHLSYRTEKTYLAWASRFRRHEAVKELAALTEDHLKHFLSYLAVERKVSAATQKQAFNALLFLYRNVLKVEINGLETVIPSKTPRRLPVVLTQEEIREIFSHLHATNLLLAGVIYGGGLRLQECLSLRVKDIDFARNCLVIRSGKGDKDRETLLSDRAAADLKCHLARIRILYERDRIQALEGVWIPEALARKYRNAGKEWSWFWVFPSEKLSIDPVSGVVRRHCLYPTTLQKAFQQAVRKAGIVKRATVHTLRHYAGCPTMPGE